MKAAVSRADLARLVADLPPARAARTAVLLGFEPPSDPEGLPGEMSGVAGTASTPIADVTAAAPVPFWRLEEMTFNDDPLPEAGVSAATGGLTADDLGGPGSLFATPPVLPLTPWPRLWPVLRQKLEGAAPGKRLDLRAIVRAFGRGEVVRRIPRMAQRAWSRRASVWVDRSARLGPFWSDQADVCRRLRRWCGRSGLEVRLLDARTQARSIARRGDLLAGFRPDPATPVLVLGDLGGLGSGAEQEAWSRTARRLADADVRAGALVPIPRARWAPHAASAWAATPWEQGWEHGAVSAPPDAVFWEERATRLLRLASSAMLVQPGLLRALRRLLPARQADAATEADVWSHAGVRASDATGLVLDAKVANAVRGEFAREVDVDLKARVSDAIGQWHSGLPRELLHAEALVWNAGSPEVAPPGGDLAGAIAFVHRLAVTVLNGKSDPGRSAEARRYAQLLLPSVPDAAYLDGDIGPSLRTVLAAAYEGVSGVHVPPSVDVRELSAIRESAAELRSWGVRQVGGSLTFSLSGGAWPSHETSPGSPVAWIMAAGQHLFVTRGEGGPRTQLLLEPGLSLPLHAGECLRLETDRCSAVLRIWTREAWAAGAGRDWLGLWADADVNGAMHRFRWIPPGRVRMVLPQGEAAPTRTKGFWLANTQLPSSLWEAMVGDEHRDSEEARQTFLKGLNSLVPYLEARFSSEAEWDYACRVGIRPGDLGALNMAEMEELYPSREVVLPHSQPLRPGSQRILTREVSPMGLYGVPLQIAGRTPVGFRLALGQAPEPTVEPGIETRSGSATATLGDGSSPRPQSGGDP